MTETKCPKCNKPTKTRTQFDPFGRPRVFANCCNVRIPKEAKK
jgi:hypothetical protein